MNTPASVGVLGAGNLFIADTFNRRIRMVGVNGIITAVAGTVTEGFSGNGGPVTNAGLDFSLGVAVDDAGNFLVADNDNLRICKVGPMSIAPMLVRLPQTRW
jgi:hypothetical protein